MKVEFQRNPKLKYLKCGEIFTTNYTCVYMKTDYMGDESDSYLVVCMDNGRTYFLHSDIEVIPLGEFVLSQVGGEE